MNYLRLTIITSIVFLLISCGGSSSEQKINKNDANTIITYYNQTIGLFRKAPSNEKYAEMIDFMEKKDKKMLVLSPILTTRVSLSDSADFLQPQNCFTKTQKDSLKVAFRDYFSSSEDFTTNYLSFKSYRKNEDYKDDNWAQGDKLIESNKQLLQKIVNSKNIIYSIIVPLAEEAEIVIIGESPLKDPILKAKKIFANMDNLMELASEDQPDFDAIDISYESLEKNVNEAKELIPAKDSEQAMIKYQKYLKEVDSFIGTLRKAKRDKKITKSLFDDLQRNYKYSVSEYNKFIE